MDINYWIAHLDSLPHQLFAITMAGLYALALVFGTTYKIINMLVYFVVIPATWVVGLFFIPNFSEFCNYAFDQCVVFLNNVARLIGSDYINISVYICVYGVALVYLILLPICFSKRTTKRVLVVFIIVMALYLLLIYPNLKSFVLFLMDKGVFVERYFNPLN